MNKVLLIEDDPWYVEEFTSYFKDVGFSVKKTEDYQTAENLIKDRLLDFDAIVINHQIKTSPYDDSLKECGVDLINLAARLCLEKNHKIPLVFWSTQAEPNSTFENVCCLTDRSLSSALPKLADLIKGKKECEEVGGCAGKKRIDLEGKMDIPIGILNLFLPLHISLQAFFGYEEFPRNEYAFSLVREAQWDFYASIFDRLADGWKSDPNWRPNFENDEEKDEYDEEKNPPILQQIGEFFKLEGVTGDREGLEAFARNKDLLRLCALLANTNDYKGRYVGERDRLLRELLQETQKGKCENLNNLIDKERGLPKLHCKKAWATDSLIGDYDILKRQLACFFKDKAEAIIKRIADFADNLQRIIVKDIEGRK